MSAVALDRNDYYEESESRLEKPGMAERFVKFFKLKVESIVDGAAIGSLPGLALGYAGVLASAPILAGVGLVAAGVGVVVGAYGGYKYMKRANKAFLKA